MDNKPKILYLMAGDPSIFGGGKRVFLQMMTYLNKNDFQFYSCCALNKEQEALIRKIGGQVINIDIQYDSIWSCMRSLIKLVRDYNIDIIHSQGGRADFFSRIISKFIGKKLKIVNTIATLVEGYDVSYIKKLVYVTLDRFAERYVDKFIVVSDALKYKLIKKHAISQQKIITIYNGIELQDYRSQSFVKSSRQIRKNLGIEDGEFTIGVIGRMVRQKGFEYFIQSIPRMTLSVPNVRILLVGDGPLIKDLKALCLKLSVLDKVIFTGFRSDIREILSMLDLLVIPSLVEGFPMITLEAMAMAKPVIATNIDGISEQITDGKNGILVPTKNPDVIAEAIVSLFNDREFADRIGLAARNEVKEKYSVERMVRETEKIYRSLIRGN